MERLLLWSTKDGSSTRTIGNHDHRLHLQDRKPVRAEAKYCRAENGQPAHTIRRHDQARTPFDRLCETDAITQEHKRQLKRLRAQTNPRQLRQELYAQIDQLFSLRPLLGWARYRSPIANLYLCGSGAHPGGGVMGASGRNAAREIIKDHRFRIAR